MIEKMRGKFNTRFIGGNYDLTNHDDCILNKTNRIYKFEEYFHPRTTKNGERNY